MDHPLNARDVFELARQVEQDAAEFYRRAANHLTHPDVCDLLRRLAAWEQRHEQRYARMQEALRLNPEAAGEGTADEYKALAALSIFAEDAPAWEPTEKTTPVEVLQEAIKREHAGLEFFRALVRFVADESAIEQIQKILREENEHIATLRAAITELSAQAPGAPGAVTSTKRSAPGKDPV